MIPRTLFIDWMPTLTPDPSIFCGYGRTVNFSGVFTTTFRVSPDWWLAENVLVFDAGFGTDLPVQCVLRFSCPVTLSGVLVREVRCEMNTVTGAGACPSGCATLAVYRLGNSLFFTGPGWDGIFPMTMPWDVNFTGPPMTCYAGGPLTVPGSITVRTS